ncbi:MAG: hypothetical protein JF631_09100 [Mycobacterium sp.]|nr:hypothetical protein [Mycobacterium sp.]
MALATLIAITLGCIAWSLWIRRVTWSCRWEVAATLNIALQGLAVMLMSPFASFKQYVERPATLCIPLLLVTFTIGNGSKIYKPDFFEVPTDFWLATYWLLLCGLLIYLLTYGGRALLILRKDPRSRKIANIYLVASASGILACTVRIITAYVPALQAIEGGTLVWIFACGCGAGFAITSAQSWRIKTKWFSSANR